MYIVQTSDLEKFCQTISSSQFIAIDTEFSRESTYYPRLCLMQIYSQSSVAIIDALSVGLDLKPLDKILQDKKIVKVFHSAKQDLEILYRIYGHLPQNIFDTQIAASFCGFGDYISYENLVLEIIDKKIDKTQRISDWSQRPLTEEQIEYALGDVFYLAEIYINLIGRLNHNNRLSWALEEMQALGKVADFNIDDAWQKIKNVREVKFNPLLKALAKWREQKAIENDVPRNHYLHEKYLLKLVEKIPLNVKELRDIDYFQKLDEITAHQIISLIKQTLKYPIEDELKMQLEYKESKTRDINQLKKLLKYKSDKYNIPSNLLATNFELKSLYNNQSTKMPRFLSGWRYEVFGKIALEIKKANLNSHEDNSKSSSKNPTSE